MTNMDRQLQETVTKGDTQAFLNLLYTRHPKPPFAAVATAATAETVFHENEPLPRPLPTAAGNTVLHLAVRFGHMGLVEEILRLWPEMALEENELLETPLHEAAREGKVEMVQLLVEAEPAAVYKVNQKGETAAFVAAERGRVPVVRYLLDLFPWLLMMEVDGLMSTTSVHVASSAGHTDVVKEILRVRPDFAYRKDINCCTPLHLSSGKGHLEITREFLRFDEDLSMRRDSGGRTPLHCAAIRGRVTIIDEILSTSLESAYTITDRGETVLHLAVKNNQYEAVKYLVETIDVTELVNLSDNDGNTILHLATVAKLNTMVIYLLKLGIDVNAINRRGFTALDVIESDTSNSGTLVILPALLESGAKRCEQLPPGSAEIIHTARSSPAHHSHRIHRRVESNSHRIRRKKQIELQNEGLRNARKTITVVAVLIATVTFAAGINPPGGFSQETGKTLMGKTTSFKVFMLCNIIALFSSLSIVIFLVSIIPFKRKSLMKLMTVSHKVMWVSTSFMAVAYIAGVWTILPHGRRGGIWVLAAVVSIGGGSTVAIIVGLGVLLARHWLRKVEWRRKTSRRRKKKNRDDGSPHSSISRVEEMQMTRRGSNESTSSNSDMDSSEQGYHLY